MAESCSDSAETASSHAEKNLENSGGSCLVLISLTILNNSGALPCPDSIFVMYVLPCLICCMDLARWDGRASLNTLVAAEYITLLKVFLIKKTTLVSPLLLGNSDT